MNTILAALLIWLAVVALLCWAYTWNEKPPLERKFDPTDQDPV